MVITWLLDELNFPLSPWRIQLFEIADLFFIPPVLRQCSQSILAWQWANKIPLLQSQAPADHVADILSGLLSGPERDEPDPCSFTILDFCSGSGGPVPWVERSVNNRRRLQGKLPVNFVLSDLHPNLDDWIPLVESSGHIKFLPQPVDAVKPSHAASDAVVSHSRFDCVPSAKHKVIHLYCLSFNHFTDDQARTIMNNTMKTADGIAIVELQERRVASAMAAILRFWLVYVIVLLGFLQSPSHMLLTFGAPALPAMIAFDALVRCLGCRTIDELWRLALVAQAQRSKANSDTKRNEFRSSALNGYASDGITRDWTFLPVRRLHTFPLGHLTCFLGVKGR
ncbi:MAG: hypothetical protein Q9162_006476 [Coniocarpon cinnabarinum]